MDNTSGLTRRQKQTIACREQRADYKAHGICISCGRNDAEIGHVLCKACIANAKLRQQCIDPDGSKRREYKKQLRESRKAQGLCIECGKPAWRGRTRCYTHILKARESCQVYKIKKRLERQAKQEREELLNNGRTGK